MGMRLGPASPLSVAEVEVNVKLFNLAPYDRRRDETFLFRWPSTKSQRLFNCSDSCIFILLSVGREAPLHPEYYAVTANF